MKKKMNTILGIALITALVLSGCIQQPESSSQATSQSNPTTNSEPVPSIPKGPSPDQLIKEQAVKQLDASLCETISDQQIKKGCFFEIANNANDASLCTKVEESKRKYCEAAAGS